MSRPLPDETLVDRLAGVTKLRGVPRAELGWLAANGTLRTHEVGYLLRRGEPIDELWIVLEGRAAIHVDRGHGPRKVLSWGGGEIAGLMPFSRMTHIPGDAVIEETVEMVAVRRERLPDLVRECPRVTEALVQVMLDRARVFNSSDMLDEKLRSLGRLSAGLAHELNNPSSAAARGAKLLMEGILRSDSASRALGAAGLSAGQVAVIDRVRDVCLAGNTGTVLAPLEMADREDEIAGWAQGHGLDPGVAHALSQTPITIAQLDELVVDLPPEAVGLTLTWIAEGCSTRRLAHDIETTASRIHQLVSAMKRVTYMDRAATLEPVDIARGLADAVTIMGFKARESRTSVSLELPDQLPEVLGNGSEINQVWMNLLDNALDAVAPSGQGHVVLRASSEVGWVVVRVIDNGPGIPADVVGRIFDPFFTTKAVGEGTGLGLDLVHKVVNRHGGEVDVNSRPGRTEFRVALPTRKEPNG